MAAARRGRGRLSRSVEFDRVYRQGRARGNRFLTVHTFPRGDSSPSAEARVGLSVSRRVGGAVDRNRIKRLIREAVAAESARLGEGLDVVIVARPDAKGLAEREGLEGIRDALRELLPDEAAK